VFESSHIPLSKWLMALYLLASSKKGMSAHQLYRMLGLKSYKSAWFMAHRLRYAMTEGPNAALLRGVVEVDETYVGGRRRLNRNGRRGHPDGESNKTPVVALVERNGRVRAMPMPRVTQENLAAAVFQNVDLNSTMMTDEYVAYPRIGRQMRKHETVNHGKDEYVRGEAHTNTVEGFFSLLKRGINGVYHHVGRGHLGRYVDEFSFRYNNRKITDGERAGLVVKGADGKRLTYKMPAAS
jgi:hypothetical protein